MNRAPFVLLCFFLLVSSCMGQKKLWPREDSLAKGRHKLYSQLAGNWVDASNPNYTILLDTDEGQKCLMCHWKKHCDTLTWFITYSYGNGSHGTPARGYYLNIFPREFDIHFVSQIEFPLLNFDDPDLKIKFISDKQVHTFHKKQ